MTALSLRHGLALLGAEAIVLLARLGLGIVLIRSLNREAFGHFSYVHAAVGLLMVTALPGMVTAVQRSVARGYEGTLLTGARAMHRGARWGGVALLGLAGYYRFVEPVPSLAGSFLIVAVLFLLTAFTELFRALWGGRGQFTRLAVATVIQHVGVMSVTAAAAWWSRSVVVTLAASFGAATLIQGGLYLYAVAQRTATPPERDTLAYGRQLTYQALLFTIAINIDKLLVAHLLGFGSLALYAVAVTVEDQARRGGNVIATLLFPRFSRQDGVMAYRWLRARWAPLALGYLVLIAAGMVATPWAVPWCFGPTYRPAVPYVQFALAVTWCDLLAGLVSKVLFTTQRRSRELYQLGWLTLVGQLGWYLLLIPWFGLWGALWGNLLTALAVLGAGLGMAQRLYASPARATGPIPVLFVIDRLTIGGVQQVLLTHLRGLNRRWFRPHICLLHDRLGPLGEELRKLAVPITVIPLHDRWDATALWRLYRLIRRHRFAVVQTALWSSDTYGTLAARLAGVPAVFSTVNNLYRWKRPREVWFDRWVAGLADQLLPCSDAVKQFTMRQLRLPASKMTTVLYGISTPNGSATLPEPNNGRPILGVVGALKEQKGHRYLLDALPALLRRWPQLQLWCIGGGGLRSSLEAQAKRLGLAGCVTFLGEQREPRGLVERCDVMVAPSLWEGFGLAIVEAMACAKPIVASGVDGILEIVRHEETGVLVPPGHPDALAAAIDRLLSRPDEAQAMGQRGRQHVETWFRAERMTGQLSAIYLTWLTRKGHQPLTTKQPGAP